jgi:hypothetical protein
MAQTVTVNRDRSPLTVDQLRAGAPSIFAEAPHDSRSNRYLYVPTIEMVEALDAEGFKPVWASQAKTRDASRTNFTKHMIRFCRPGDGQEALATLRSQYGAHHMIQRDDTVQSPTWGEIVLTNAHDGSSSVQESSGVFCYACSNGLIASAGQGDTFRFNHTAKWRDDIIEGAYRVIDNLTGPVAEQIGAMQGRELSQPERLLLAEHAATLRWHGDTPPVPSADMLRVRRTSDRDQNAWTTLNVLQENAIRGGLPYTHGTGWNRQQRHTGAVTGIDDLTKINRGIWEAVTTLTTGNRVDLAADMFARLSPEERGQLAQRFS